MNYKRFVQPCYTENDMNSCKSVRSSILFASSNSSGVFNIGVSTDFAILKTRISCGFVFRRSMSKFVFF